MKTLYQLHHEFRDHRTEFVAQCEIHSADEFIVWFNDVQARHPLPEGAMWLAVPEGSPRFLYGSLPLEPEEPKDV